MAEALLNAITREELGKQAVKKLRAEGLIPATLYGAGVDSSSLTLNRKELTTLLQSSGRNVVVDLSVDKGKKSVKTFIYEIQHDPLTDKITHVDLKHINLDDKINIEVPVHLEGVADGVKNEGGISEHIMHTIEISCLPSNIPSELVIDMSALQIGDSIHVKDLPTDNFDFISDPDRTVVHVIAPRVMIVEEEEEEGLEGLEGIEDELEEGAAEPEVIGKKPEDGEE
jgi:large subunit ribosomal protein L25